MAEDYRAELNHKWAMKRLNETIEAIRRDILVIDEDIASVRHQNMEESNQ